MSVWVMIQSVHFDCERQKCRTALRDVWVKHIAVNRLAVN